MNYHLYFERFSSNSRTDVQVHEVDLPADSDVEAVLKAESQMEELSLGHPVHWGKLKEGERIVKKW